MRPCSPAIFDGRQLEAVQKEMNSPTAKKGEPVDGVLFEDVRPVLHAMTDDVLLEIQGAFDFFKATRRPTASIAFC